MRLLRSVPLKSVVQIQEAPFKAGPLRLRLGFGLSTGSWHHPLPGPVPTHGVWTLLTCPVLPSLFPFPALPNTPCWRNSSGTSPLTWGEWLDAAHISLPAQPTPQAAQRLDWAHKGDFWLECATSMSFPFLFWAAD